MGQLWNVVRLVAGVVLIATATFDFVLTAVTVGGRAGPVSLRVADLLHRLLSRRNLRDHPRLGRLVGPSLLLGIFLTWLFAISLGWALVFSTEGAITRPEDVAASLVDPFEFVFATLLGRGGGLSLGTSEPFWTVMQVLLGLMGVGFVTLSLAWVLPVVSGVASRREVAAKLAAMGSDAEDVLLTAWDGSGYGNLDLHLQALTTDLAALAQRHLAYPAIHYYHSHDWRTSIGPRLAVIDDALSLMALAAETPGVPRSSIVSLRRVVTDYLDAIDEAFLSDDQMPAPPPPATGRLREAGLLQMSEDEVAERFDRIADRRARLHAYVCHDGWTWSQAMQAGSRARAGEQSLDALTK